MNPGIYTDLDEDRYHAIDAIGSTSIKKFHDRPSSLQEPFEPSEDMNLGSAQDVYSLVGPEAFFKKFMILPDFGDLRNTNNKAKKKLFIEENPGKICLPCTVTPKNIPTLQAIYDVDEFLFKKHPLSKVIMRQGQKQVSIFWQDEETKLPCKGRFDHYPDPSIRTIYDLKKCGNLGKFEYQIESLRYFLQAGHYVNGANANNHDVDSFAFVAFNFGDPPEIRVVYLTPDYLAAGRDIAKTTIRLIKECRQAQKWPPYKIPLGTLSMAKMLGLPSNAYTQMTEFDLIDYVELPYRLK